MESRLQIPTRHGDVQVYRYLPEKAEKPLPVIVNFHGGGFIKGYREKDTLFARNLCCHTNCMVLDIDYKTAPEYPYPYALEEGYDGISYIWSHGEELGIRPDKIILSGQSAGGNLAAGITLMAKERKEFDIRLVLLSYPVLDLAKDPGEKSFAEQESERVKTARMYNNCYIEQP